MRQRGFTLIEMVVTVLIVSILAAGAMPVMQLSLQRSKEAELRAALRNIRSAIDAYKKAYDDGKVRKSVDQSGYPPNLEILEKGIVDQTQPGNKIIRFIRRIPRDPLNQDKELAPAATWGKRSYQSDADAPSEGADVYDVYTLSMDKAVNGTWYREW